MAAACSHKDPREPGFWPAGRLTLIRSSFACGGGVDVDGEANPRERDQGRLRETSSTVLVVTLYISEPRILYLFCILSRLNLEIDNGVRSVVGVHFRMHGVY